MFLDGKKALQSPNSVLRRIAYQILQVCYVGRFVHVDVLLASTRAAVLNGDSVTTLSARTCTTVFGEGYDAGDASGADDACGIV